MAWDDIVRMGLVPESSGGGGDLGVGNVWSGSDLDAAIASAGANLANGDALLSTTTYDYWTPTLLGGDVGTHYLPAQVPVSTTQAAPGLTGIVTEWRGVDPVAASVADWNNTSESGSPSYTVTDGVLTLAGDGSGDTARINYNDGAARLDGPHLIVIDDLSAVAQPGTLTGFPQIQFRFEQSDRFLQLRPSGDTASDVWGIAITGSNLDITGATIGTAHRLEIYCNPTTQQVRVRVDGGTWQAFNPTMPTVAGNTISVIALAAYNLGTQSISLSSMLVASAT